MAYPVIPIADRLMSRLDTTPGHGPTGTCHVWTGCVSGPMGYGTIMRAKGKPANCHRVAYELAHGPIPAGLLVRHTCDNGPCCNPDHLVLGTHKQNAADRDERGRNHERNKTHCRAGHPYDEANTRVYRSQRYCRACQKASRAKRS